MDREFRALGFYNLFKVSVTIVKDKRALMKYQLVVFRDTFWKSMFSKRKFGLRYVYSDAAGCRI
jgi:hypothetical protein